MLLGKLSRWVKWLLSVLMATVVALTLAVAAFAYFQHWLDKPLSLDDDGYTYELQSGQSVFHVAKHLEADQVLNHGVLLRLYARLHKTNRIHAGEYQLEKGLTPRGLLEKLEKGDVILHQVTLVEGWTFKQALTAIHKNTLIKPLLADKSESEQLALLALDISHPEGWFFPDTYTFSRGASDIDILRDAHRRMTKILDEAWASKREGLPYKTPYDALIMASIIERETGHHSERDQIAGVFVRRLQIGMRLQTDPTVIYGMGDRYDGRIRRSDLMAATAYNTYVIDALPPTPISLPGLASIKAALHPAEGKALYFVAKGDGTSEFSNTLAEHNKAVRRYQLNRRADYRAAPPVTTSAASTSSASQ